MHRMRPEDLKVQLMTLKLKNFNNIGLTMKFLVILKETFAKPQSACCLIELVLWEKVGIKCV